MPATGRALAMKPQLDSLAALQGDASTTRDTSAVRVPEYLNVGTVAIRGSEELSDRQILSYFRIRCRGGSAGWTSGVD